MTLQQIAIAGLTVALLSSAAWAEGFRCPRTGRIIDEGDTTFDVRAKCGEPSSQERISSRRRGVDERWIYDFGPQYLTRVLWFKNGQLIQVDVGWYGRIGAH